MNLHETQAFVEVVRAGSFTQAAKHLGVPKSTLSFKVSSLEKRLGLTLLQRSTRQQKLTKAGLLYYERCFQILEQLKEAEEFAAAEGENPKGKIRLTAAIEFGTTMLPEALARFHSLYPDIQLEVDLSDRIVDLIQEGFDIAIRAGKMQDSSLKAKKLGLERFALFASPKFLQKSKRLEHPKALENLRCLHFSPGNLPRIWSMTNGRERFRHELKENAWQSNSLSLVRSWAAESMGIAFLPTFLCRSSLQSGELIRVLPEWESEQHAFYLVYPNQKFLPPRTRLLLDFLGKEFLKVAL